VNKKFILLITLLPLLASCLPPHQIQGFTPEAASPTLLPDFAGGLQPEYQNVVKELEDASLYTIELNIADDMYQISGGERVDYTNNEDVDLTEIQLRLFQNILAGSMSVGSVRVNGNLVTPQYSLNNSLMIIPLDPPLKPKDKLSLSMDFKESVAQNVNLNYGVQAYFNDVLALAHAYPMVAVYDDTGWNAEIPPQSGDVTYADMSFFNVTVQAPKQLTLAATGRETGRQDNGSRQTVKFESGPARDFYLAASSKYQVYSKESHGVTIRFYTRRDLKEGAIYALNVAAQALDDFGNRYARYPYTELDFVSTPTLALGIEYPGMIAIKEEILADVHNRYLETTIVHETGHQWFYNLVGNDQLDEPWLDESMAQFATLQYFSDEHGQAGYDEIYAQLEGRWSQINQQNIPVGLPVRAYSGAEYSGIVYGRGALFFVALRDQIGPAKFDQFMKNYVRDDAWGISAPQILQAEAEKACICDLSGLFQTWIYP